MYMRIKGKTNLKSKGMINTEVRITVTLGEGRG